MSDYEDIADSIIKGDNLASKELAKKLLDKGAEPPRSFK